MQIHHPDTKQWKIFTKGNVLFLGTNCRQMRQLFVMVFGVVFGVCHIVHVMISWLGCLVLLDTLWLLFSINSVWKQAPVPVPFHKGQLQMTVHDQRKQYFLMAICFFTANLFIALSAGWYWSRALDSSSERDWKWWNNCSHRKDKSRKQGLHLHKVETKTQENCY